MIQSAMNLFLIFKNIRMYCIQETINPCLIFAPFAGVKIKP